jgi:septal ring factor EnvC (AmiA/AmiB activator)
MKIVVKNCSIAILLCLSFVSILNAANEQDNKEITNRMLLEKIELYHSITNTKFELLIQHMNERFKQVEKRIEQVEKRIEQVDKRIEQVEKRIGLLENHAKEVNIRFEMIDKRFEMIDKRFEMIDKRFEDLLAYMNKRFDDVGNRLNFLEILFVALLAATIGTPIIIEVRREKKMKQMINESQDIQKLIETFRELAKKDESVHDVLKKIDEKFYFYGYN